MAGLCEGDNEPAGSLKTRLETLDSRPGAGGGGVKLTRKASETRLATPGEKVASPIGLVSGFALKAPGGSDYTNDCVPCH
ncbi:hypothetical protein ANN_12090 [Periplaneta americana]|uniref:Uncharacterized protein n=1 Tax=Periplaneta americana TaxID=6978 RepID=A0ABQ8T6V8_PERAM|nr:hypothetical protein ANN_12090 [Periplaneta americana]